MNYAEVYLWGTRIGALHLSSETNITDFQYDRNFVDNVAGSGIELSPLRMPISNRIYRFSDIGDSFKGVPGMIADSLPDKFGNAVINSWLASQGKSDSDFNVIDRLCYTGKRGMGALEYVPAQGPEFNKDSQIDIDEMVKFASDILANRKSIHIKADENLQFSQLLQLGTSAGGARAKAIIAWNESTNEIRSGQIDAGKGFDYWLMKFDGVNKNGDHGLTDEPEYTLIEYAYYEMARMAGITMNECRIFKENGRNHFMTKRFDRKDGNKVHMQTLGALAHIDYSVPALCSYEQAAMYMQQMRLKSDEIEQFFRRMVFNVMAVNQDDHVKNISFLMDRNGKWKLSPAYDITFSYNLSNVWLKAHQMRVNGKVSAITMNDLHDAGKAMGISTSKRKKIIQEVHEAVSNWTNIAERNGIRENTMKNIKNVIQEHNSILFSLD
ncbi:type II toxin-antitoxin system HipA family toxin [Butyrivibrio sp. YAB3001]|uniref:type II toxin-antitoxin system HipA family toxin n=1 Tax=Butyrivibrio sp. YAB3001 TaxID=1520812 RepID=UPI0008F66193|nr:type II toxin-antitoxin system HipA family toxin [Butyrivibrio sp. YAB3001]SFB69386.1 serine/threonine-protein kinase HipA [Butyrivibrio sp. YAB3001]